MSKILITGSAGFIGFHLSRKLLEYGEEIIGIDNINDYYDVRIKYDRLKCVGIKEDSIRYNTPTYSTIYPNYCFIKLNLEDKENFDSLFKEEQFDYVIHLAAQAGVRYSLLNPYAYINSNILGFVNILEGCRHNNVQHLVFASSSSVYGANTALPFSVHMNVDHPISLYASTKKSNELMAHCYASLYKTPCTGLRFFTVYGPWGRPDMALYKFTKNILEGKPIELFNYGDMKRDFTYIDDIVEAVIRVKDRIPEPNRHWNSNDPDPASSFAPYKLYNIGNNNPVRLLRFVEIIEACLGRKAEKKLLPLQAGDIPETYAHIDDLIKDVAFKPQTSVEEGIKKFIQWYREYYTV